MRKVLDAWTILAWLQAEEPAQGRVRALLEKAEADEIRLAMSMINVGEVFYLVAKRQGSGVAEEFLADLPAMPVKLLLPDRSLILDAARLKGAFPISYADAFAVATARREHAPLVTGDPELRVLVAEQVVQLDWIGSTEQA